jgi:hypothetical protein
MLVFFNTIINISLLKDNASNYKLKYISLYINLLKGVKIINVILKGLKLL